MSAETKASVPPCDGVSLLDKYYVQVGDAVFVRSEFLIAELRKVMAERSPETRVWIMKSLAEGYHLQVSGCGVDAPGCSCENDE